MNISVLGRTPMLKHGEFDPFEVNNSDENFDKTKSISELNNRELRLMLSRLRLERETEDVIRSLRLNAGEKYDYDNPSIVDTTTPISSLYHLAASRINGQYIAHHGILGQRWGIRRYQNEDGTRTAAGKKRDLETQKVSDDHIQKVTSRRNATQGLSNAELKSLNERLQLEKTYRDLTAAETKQGESFSKTVMKDIAKQSLTEAGKALSVGLLKQFVTDPILDAAKKGATK